MSTLSPEHYYRRNLPHIQPAGVTFFITCRLFGSLPAHVIAELHAEFQRQKLELQKIPDSFERDKQIYLTERLFFGKYDAALDAGHGPHYLRTPAVAELVGESIRHFDKQRYHLIGFCIMPNHMHYLLTPMQKNELEYFSLAQINHSFKGFTATQANELLNRNGQFWQHESFDHIVRDEQELHRIKRYILNNPVKANLVQTWQEWPFSYCKDGDIW